MLGDVLRNITSGAVSLAASNRHASGSERCRIESTDMAAAPEIDTHFVAHKNTETISAWKDGRSGRIRTCDPCVPNVSQQKQRRPILVDHLYRRLFTGFRWSIGGWLGKQMHKEAACRKPPLVRNPRLSPNRRLARFRLPAAMDRGTQSQFVCGRRSTHALRRQRSHVRIVSGAPFYARASDDDLEQPFTRSCVPMRVVTS